jgi:hypothetical protein
MRRAMIGAVKFYQRNVSPNIGPHCKYQPTCSEYMIGCLETHGVLKGLPMGLWRIIRCNPFSKGGYDPVPCRKENR